MPLLDLAEIKRFHDKGYTYGQINRIRAADDMVFYYVTQWDDQLLSTTNQTYRGEFNILKKAGRQIISDLAENPVQVDFEPKDETRDDAAELLDGMYRSDDNNNTTIESYDVGKQEAIVCGFGAWKQYTEYGSLKGNNRNQVIKRKPIYEANNCVFWDGNAKLLDKSDATYVSVLTFYSEQGYIDLVKELTGEEIDSIDAGSFKFPEQSYTFPWIEGEGQKIYVTDFYYREKVKEKVLTMKDPFDQEIELRESDLKDVMDDMIDEGFSIVAEKEIERYQVTQYIASGKEILSTNIIAGEHIPIIPVYGERAYVEGEEHYEGVTRLAKDPQRLRNFAMSYIAEIVSKSPRQKPIYYQEQIAGFEDFYSENGVDDNYAYRLMNRFGADSQPLPLGPVGMTPEQPLPTALIPLLQLTKEAVEDVANPGIPQDVADVDMSGKAIHALQTRIDMQSLHFQTHYKHAKRRDAEIYASIASEIYDVPRKVMLTMPDGTKKQEEVMSTVIDKETGNMVTLNDLNNSEFEVFSKIGPSYSSQKEQTIEKLTMIMQSMQPNDPMRRAVELKIFTMMDGVEFDDIREYANNELVLTGVKKPETPEEEQLVADAQQKGQEPTAEMVLAQGEMMKGQAALGKNEIELMKVQTNSANEEMKRQIDGFEARLEAQKVQIEAQKANADIDNKDADTMGKKLDNIAKEKEGIEIPDLDYEGMTDDDLYDVLLEA